MTELLKRLWRHTARVEHLEPSEARGRLQRGAVLLDVRSSAERAQVKIPQSRTMPHDAVRAQWITLPKDREIICQCARGELSAQIADFLARRGLNVAHLSGGLQAWEAAGLPVRRGQ
jgi:rhodanese-related sulfurtransferase